MRRASLRAITAIGSSRWKITKNWKVEVLRLPSKKVPFFRCFFMIFWFSKFHKSGVEKSFFVIFFKQCHSNALLHCRSVRRFFCYFLDLRLTNFWKSKKYAFEAYFAKVKNGLKPRNIFSDNILKISARIRFWLVPNVFSAILNPLGFF